MAAGERFGARLRAATAARGPLCVGVDPHPGLLARWGLSDDVAGLDRFSATVVEAFAEHVAVVKPQSAFYERFGSAGIAILESVIRQFRSRGALVILDAKRGDIGSTVAAYAAAYLDRRGPLFADALTASPFLGFGSLSPMIDTAVANGAGVFVLARTSNPEGGSVQAAVDGDGRTVGQLLIDECAQVNRGVKPLGDIGVVVGATVRDSGLVLTDLNGPILAPGLGAQGATAADLPRVFGPACHLVLPTYSREVLAAGPSVGTLRDAAARCRDACAAALGGTG